MSVVVDSSVCLTANEAACLGIELIPMQLIIDGRTYRDAIDISARDFYRSLRMPDRVHTTASPTVIDYLSAYRRSSGDVLCLTVASTLSATNQTAQIAAEMARAELASMSIEVIDSQTTAGGLRLLVQLAAQLVREGADLGDIAARIKVMLARVRMFGALETTAYLAHSGRLPFVVTASADLLGVRPVIEFSHGNGRLIRLCRSAGGARKLLSHLVQAAAVAEGTGPDGVGVHAAVFHADAQTEACLLRDDLRKRLPSMIVSLSEMTPVLGVHTGPGAVGYAFYVPPSPRPVDSAASGQPVSGRGRA